MTCLLQFSNVLGQLGDGDCCDVGSQIRVHTLAHSRRRPSCHEQWRGWGSNWVLLGRLPQPGRISWPLWARYQGWCRRPGMLGPAARPVEEWRKPQVLTVPTKGMKVYRTNSHPQGFTKAKHFWSRGGRKHPSVSWRGEFQWVHTFCFKGSPIPNEGVQFLWCRVNWAGFSQRRSCQAQEHTQHAYRSMKTKRVISVCVWCHSVTY